MASNNNGNSSNSGTMTQKGREALERFKMESASELGVNLKQGYNGDLTSREAGSIGGRMVQKILPEQQSNAIRVFGKNNVVFTYHIHTSIIIN